MRSGRRSTLIITIRSTFAAAARGATQSVANATIPAIARRLLKRTVRRLALSYANDCWFGIGSMQGQMRGPPVLVDMRDHQRGFILVVCICTQRDEMDCAESGSSRQPML